MRSIKKCLLASGPLQRQGHTAYRMHRLVQASVISRVVAPVAEDTGDGGCHADSGDVERAARGIRSAWQTVYDETKTSTWLAADLLVPHVQCLFDRCVGHGGQLSADTVCAIVDERLLQSCTWHITWNRHSLHSAATIMLCNCDNILTGAVGVSDSKKVLGSVCVQNKRFGICAIFSDIMERCDCCRRSQIYIGSDVNTILMIYYSCRSQEGSLKNKYCSYVGQKPVYWAYLLY